MDDIRIVLGSLRYKSAPNTNLFFQVPLKQTFKENTEFDIQPKIPPNLIDFAELKNRLN